jgi:hypothetical protein
MYALATMKCSKTTDIDILFLNYLKRQVRKEMSQFDLILKVDDFQNIPCQLDEVKPDKGATYREFINKILNEILAVDSPWSVLDATTLKKIQVVTGTREQRMAQAINYLQIMNRGVLFSKEMTKFIIFQKLSEDFETTNEQPKTKTPLVPTIASKL